MVKITVGEILKLMNYDGRVLIRDKDAVCGGHPDYVIRRAGDRVVRYSFVGFEGALVFKVE